MELFILFLKLTISIIVFTILICLAIFFLVKLIMALKDFFQALFNKRTWSSEKEDEDENEFFP